MIAVPALAIVVALLALASVRLRPVEGVADLGLQERGHDIEAEFAEEGLPPVGGEHNPNWQNCGIYTNPVETSLAVHSMEHGAVWLTYRPDLTEEGVAALQDLVRGESYLLLSPYPSQTEDLVLSAWGVQLIADDTTDERIDGFISRYKGRGPEPGAPCTGGVGTPVR